MTSWFARSRLWLRSRFRTRSVRAEIDDELRYHLSMRASELEAEGLTPAAARHAALERFGDEDRIRDACRTMYYVDGTGEETMMSDFVGDVRFGLRTLRRQPGFAAAVIMTLGLGIGANSAIFSVLDAVLLQPLPYDAPGELVRIWQADRINGTRFENFSVPDFHDVTTRSRDFESAAMVKFRSPTLTGPEDNARRLVAVAASRSLVPTLGVPMSRGRWFTVDEDRPGGPSVAVLGHGLWTERFGRDEAVVGRSIHLDGLAYRVVGVAGPELAFPQRDVHAWIPLQLDRDDRPRGQHNFRVVARLAPGASLDAANAGLRDIAAALENEHPDDNTGREMWAQPLHESIVGDVSAALYLLFAGVGLVLLIACLNVANLLLVRGGARAREVAIRRAMGAPRTRLLRQLITEHSVLGLLGGVVGLGLAIWAVRVLVSVGPASIPRLEDVAVDGSVVWFTVGVTLLTVAVCGVLPAVSGARVQLTTTLADGPRTGATNPRAQRLGRALVVSQVAMAVVLVSTAGLVVESVNRLRGVDPGFDAHGVFSASMELPTTRYEQPRPEWPNYPEVLGFQNQLIDRVAAIPGVTHVGLAMNGPTDPGWTTAFSAERVPAGSVEATEEVRIRIISAGYPEAVGMQLVRGRLPERFEDRHEAPPVALINEALERRYFADQDPIGSWIANWGTRREIIGVVRDVRFMGAGEEAEPAVYPLFSHMPLASFSVLARTTGDAAALATPVRQVVSDLDPELAIGSVGSLDAMLAETTSEIGFNAMLLSLFALLSLLLAAIGVYGVVAQGVSQRTHEIGVRLSLGASGAVVARSIVRQSMGLTALGLLIGLLGALATSSLLAGLLFEVQPNDATNVLRVVAVAAVVGLVAAWVPARRASRVDPLRAVTGR